MQVLKKIKHVVFYLCEDENEIANHVGDLVISLVKSTQSPSIGLSGEQALNKTHKYLIKDFKENNTNYKKTKVFLMDEYLNINKENQHKSVFESLYKRLFSHLNFKTKNLFSPTDYDEIDPSLYDRTIWKNHGIDLMILGVGKNGHIGFNEPGTGLNTLTHIVDASTSTRESSKDFIKTKPKYSLPTVTTMGIRSILNTRQIAVVAFGKEKAEAIKQLAYSLPNSKWPCTVLKRHSSVSVFLDKAAAKFIQN